MIPINCIQFERENISIRSVSFFFAAENAGTSERLCIAVIRARMMISLEQLSIFLRVEINIVFLYRWQRTIFAYCIIVWEKCHGKLLNGDAGIGVLLRYTLHSAIVRHWTWIAFCDRRKWDTVNIFTRNKWKRTQLHYVMSASYALAFWMTN